MYKSISIILSVLLGLVLLNACSSELSYEDMVQQGLDSGVQNDSLFLGYHFGMSSDEFHSTSWELNQQGLITGMVKVYYTFDDLKSSATKEYFPTFQDGKIVRIPVTIQYDAWAPWNQQFWPEQLTEDLIEYYGDVYGASFNSVYVPELEKFAEVAIQGNREIRIYRNSESSVMVDFIDLNVFGSKD